MASPTDREAQAEVAPHEGVGSDPATSHVPARDPARMTAPDVTAPAVEAAGMPRPQAAPGASEPCPGKVQQLIIGYEPGIPLQGGDVETRALRVLDRAFPEPCYDKTLTSMRRED